MQMEIEVKGQRIKRINSPGSVEDTLNYLTCHFIFSGEEWDNTVKTAYFENPASGKRHPKILADDGTCTVPWEALTDKGFVRFSVAGERDGYRITTGIESFYNSETVYGGEPSEPPTPSQYDQLIALAEQTKEIAESVREDADAGEFDGEPGEQGKPGAPGRDGVSPTAKVEQTDDGAVITITDATGTTTAELKNGKEGNPGQNATDEQVRGAVDAYMAEHPVQVDTDDLIKIAIKEEASGAVPISITDSADMGVQDIKMQGWTEQAQYEGNQLFDKSGIVLTSKVQYIPVNVGDGEFTLSTQYNNTYRRDVFFLPGNVTDGASSSENGVALNNPKTVTSENGYVTVGLRTNPEGDMNPLDYDIMLNSGSTALPYEPYTGGQPSPNPDYPQEIVSAGKYNEDTQKYEYQVKLTGKNLWNAEEAAETSKWVASKTQKGYSDFAIDVAPGQRITFSFPEKLPLGITMYVAIVSIEDGNVAKWLYHSTSENLIVQQAAITAITDKIWVRCNTGSIEGFVQDNPYFQIEYGSKRTAFQPYKEQTVTLTADRPLTKWDRLEKRDGVWGWVYKSAEIVLDGNERTWRDYPTYKGYFCTDLPFSASRREGYAENIIVDTSMSKASTFSCWLGVNNNFVYVINAPQYDANLPDRGIQNWRDWLSENPLTILTYLDEETFVPLSESEQEQMNALHTYYPTTVLSNDTECEMSIKYIADTKTYIDSKIAAIQAAVVNTI